MKGKKARARHHTGPVFAVAYGLRELDKHGEAFSFFFSFFKKMFEIHVSMCHLTIFRMKPSSALISPVCSGSGEITAQ